MTSPGLTGMGPLSSRSAETGMTPSVFCPMSKNTFSSLMATTVASRPCSPAVSCVWVCSNWLRMSPKELSASGGFCLSCSRTSSSRSDEIGLDIGVITFLLWHTVSRLNKLTAMADNDSGLTRRGFGVLTAGALSALPAQLAAQAPAAGGPLDIAEWSYHWYGVEHALLAR